ncbi:hypothetical protein [Brevibacillus sp. NRS-1366]|uniref:hypothetical protein n=1 Tax=Brevibacillus sp. NRS-1366 TaxID=3233899 RepID=UPI003D2463C2
MVELFINDQPFASDYLGIKQENGSVLVPVDKLTDAFHGKATIDLSKQEIKVTLPAIGETPFWIKGVFSRAGKIYVLLLPQTAFFWPKIGRKAAWMLSYIAYSQHVGYNESESC